VTSSASNPGARKIRTEMAQVGAIGQGFKKVDAIDRRIKK
jgi:hypothetical protein